MNNNIQHTLSFVNNTYDNLHYFDLYGNSVIIFIIVTLLVFTVFSYCKIIQTKEDIAKDWSNQRCKPQNMLFAGFITKPEGVSSFQYTSDNFQYCVQNILTNISEYALEPFQYIINSLTVIFGAMVSSIQNSREATSQIRTNIKVFAEDLLGRMLNITVPIQKVFIALMDVFQKIQGSMTASLYTMLGSYYTLQALMGATLDLIIKLLTSLVIIIVGLWTLPFTWPAAASMSAVFLSISIPLSIIIYFMTEVLNIKSASIPKLRCFDESTMFKLTNEYVSIKDLKIGDLLSDGNIVTAKIKVSASYLDMYQLNNTIVSGTHLMLYKNDWIRVSNHPDALKINYNKPYVYCINTNNKLFNLDGYLFSDWDEIVGENKIKLKQQHIDIEKITKGFHSKTIIQTNKGFKHIREIEIGDILSNNSVVYGIVKLRNDQYHILTNDGNLMIDNINVKDYNNIIDKFII
jgi:hypothetical protein